MPKPKHNLRRQLLLLLLFKLALLYLIKIAFFDHPLAPHMHMAPNQIDHQFFGSRTVQKPLAEGHHARLS